jgi:hypothetical protein
VAMEVFPFWDKENKREKMIEVIEDISTKKP